MAWPDRPIQGRVTGLGRGISVADAAPGVQGLPTVNPIFTWVRLAQRVPIRIDLDDVPCPIVLAAGMTANVAILPEKAGSPDALPPDRRTGAAAGQRCEGAPVVESRR